MTTKCWRISFRFIWLRAARNRLVIQLKEYYRPAVENETLDKPGSVENPFDSGGIGERFQFNTGKGWFPLESEHEEWNIGTAPQIPLAKLGFFCLHKSHTKCYWEKQSHRPTTNTKASKRKVGANWRADCNILPKEAKGRDNHSLCKEGDWHWESN